MAPMISNFKNKTEDSGTKNNNLKNEKNKLLQLRKFIEKNFDNVGKDFSKRVREIYYDKKNKKSWTVNGVTVAGESIEELRDVLNKMLEALDKEILDYE